MKFILTMFNWQEGKQPYVGHKTMLHWEGIPNHQKPYHSNATNAKFSRKVSQKDKAHMCHQYVQLYG